MEVGISVVAGKHTTMCLA